MQVLVVGCAHVPGPTYCGQLCTQVGRVWVVCGTKGHGQRMPHILWATVCQSICFLMVCCAHVPKPTYCGYLCAEVVRLLVFCGPNGNGPAHAHYLWALVGHNCNAWWWAVPKCQGTHTVGKLWAQVARLWVVCGPRVCPLHLNYGVCPVCGMTLCLALGLNTCQLQTQTSQPPTKVNVIKGPKVCWGN